MRYCTGQTTCQIDSVV